MAVEKISLGIYVVHSDSGHDYTVFYNMRLKKFVCTCPDYSYRFRPCKHVVYVSRLVREKKI
jgi:hypothetical protein